MNFFRVTLACLMVSSLGGCATPEQHKAQLAIESQMWDQLNASKANSSVTCLNKQSCDKAFSLAKIYVRDNADMKIQQSDDTIVSTYNPIDPGRIGLTATKTPGTGETATVELVASCKGMDIAFKYCAPQLTRIYNGFKPFIESRLK